MTPAAVVLPAAAASIVGAAARPVEALDVLQATAGAIGALAVVGGAIWWVVGPRVRDYLAAQQHAARVVTGADDEPSVPQAVAALSGALHAHLDESRRGLRILDNVCEQLDELRVELAAVTSVQADQAQQMAELRHDVDEVDRRVSEYLADAAAELRLARAARLLASGQLYPTPDERTHP